MFLSVLTAPHDLAEATDLRTLLSAMPMTDPEYGAWWSSEEGSWLYREITHRIGHPLTQSLRVKYGASYEPADVANTAVMVLRQDLIHVYIDRSEDPWAYLAQILKRDLTAAAGAHFRVELSDEALLGSTTPAPATSSPVSLQEAADMTYRVLAPAMPAARRRALKKAIGYFADLGGARLSHLYTHATTDSELTGLGLGREEILAIANAVLGSRPHNGQTSLLAAYLQDPGFDPRSSLMHRKALTKFQARMSRTAHQEALVG